MMQYLLPAILLAVTVLLLVIRTNAAVVFLMLCGGYAMVHVAGSDITLFSNSFKLVPEAVVLGITGIVPALLVGLFLKGSVKTSQILLMLVPALAASLLGTTLVLEQLPQHVRTSLLNNIYWSQLNRNLAPVILIGVLASMLVCIITLHKRHKDDKKKGRHH